MSTLLIIIGGFFSLVITRFNSPTITGCVGDEVVIGSYMYDASFKSQYTRDTIRLLGSALGQQHAGSC